MPRGRADLRDHGAGYGCFGWRRAGYALRGHARGVAAERNGADVRADERLPFGALAEADRQPSETVAPRGRFPLDERVGKLSCKPSPGARRDVRAWLRERPAESALRRALHLRQAAD